ncbi:MAG: thioredoxin family protein [Bacteroidales bacterium]|nr:thioredoxin family protein [Bacteroidales bacterium]
MAETQSKMNKPGFRAPEFRLKDTVSGQMMSLHDLRSEKATVVMFICNHCPFVKHVNNELVNLANDYIPKGISFIAISSNDAEAYPEDAPAKMKEHAVKLGYPFPYLYDDTQEVARAYDAACTPDFFIFDGRLNCVYCGQLDDSRPSNGKPVTGNDIRAALEAIIAGKPVSQQQMPSIGCSIKWRK